MANPSILIVTDYYLPGYKGGGPIRTIAGLVSSLGKEFQFCILTTDRDLRDKIPYRGVEPDKWLDEPECRVRYLSPKNQGVVALHRLLKREKADILHLNGLFSRLTRRILFLRWLGAYSGPKVILAPRGMLTPGSFRLKRWKKRPYLTATSLLGYYRGIVWHATNDSEASDIRREFPDAVLYDAPPIHGRRKEIVIVASDTVSGVTLLPDEKPFVAKSAGHARFIFLSRISNVKNLDGALRFLSMTNGDVSFDIFGPIDNEAYWKKCRKQIDELPKNVKVQYCGPIPHSQTATVMSGYHFLLLPTHGENFGHVIIEALSNGLPVVISDQTPWRDLERSGVGWDIGLSDDRRFVEVIERCVRMDPQDYGRMAGNAREYGRTFREDRMAVDQNRILFLQTLARA